MSIGHTSLHRLVENQEWVEPVAEAPIKETSVDGGKVRIRGPKGQGSHWEHPNFVKGEKYDTVPLLF